MKKHLPILVLLLCAIVSLQAQTVWKVDKSSVTFSIKNAGLTVEGSFSGLKATIAFDSANYAKSSIEASVEVNTINTGIEMRNKHLKKEEFFDAEKYPTISLRSSFFLKDGQGRYKGYFKLTIKNVTKDVIIPFTYMASGSTATFNGSFELNRQDYTVGGSSLMMSDNVKVNIVVDVVK